MSRTHAKRPRDSEQPRRGPGQRGKSKETLLLIPSLLAGAGAGVYAGLLPWLWRRPCC
jgi:hypothetical protein